MKAFTFISDAVAYRAYAQEAKGSFSFLYSGMLFPRNTQMTVVSNGMGGFTAALASLATPELFK